MVAVRHLLHLAARDSYNSWWKTDVPVQNQVCSSAETLDLPQSSENGPALSTSKTLTKERLVATTSDEKNAPAQGPLPAQEMPDMAEITNHLAMWADENGIKSYKVVRSGEDQFLVFYKKDGVKHADWLTYPNEQKAPSAISASPQAKIEPGLEKNRPVASKSSSEIPAEENEIANMESYIAFMLTKSFG